MEVKISSKTFRGAWERERKLTMGERDLIILIVAHFILCINCFLLEIKPLLVSEKSGRDVNEKYLSVDMQL